MIKPKFSRGLLALAIISSFGITACTPDNEASASKEQRPSRPAQGVTFVELEHNSVAITRTLTGKVFPSISEAVRPQTDGVIREVLFTEGSWIKKGDPLYQLDDEQNKAALNISRSALASAEARLSSVSQSTKRSAELIKINAISAQDHERSITELKQAQADVSLAKSTVRQNEILLSYSKIVSNTSGFAGKSSVTEGALVTARQADPMVIIQKIDPAYIEVRQSSKDLASIRKQLGGKGEGDLPVVVITESGDEYEHTGTLSLTDYKADSGTGSVLLRININNPDKELLPGMIVKAVVNHGIKDETILLPQRALQRSARGGSFVFVVKDDNTIESRPVVVSNTVGSDWILESGLEAGEKVVIEGLQKIGPGMTVNPTEKAKHTL